MNELLIVRATSTVSLQYHVTDESYIVRSYRSTI